jgi:hypothetical protein
MTELYEKQWNKQYKQLVEFKRNNGHCMVTFKYEQDKPLARWGLVSSGTIIQIIPF